SSGSIAAPYCAPPSERYTVVRRSLGGLRNSDPWPKRTLPGQGCLREQIERQETLVSTGVSLALLLLMFTASAAAGAEKPKRVLMVHSFGSTARPPSPPIPPRSRLR